VRRMQPTTLKTFLEEMGLKHADFARLLGVTPRAVTLWLSGEREMPGPAEAYMRLYRSLPPPLRQLELTRMSEGASGMRDGMFGITFHGQADSGYGLLVLEAGRVYGVDVAGVRYDGQYEFDADAGRVHAVVKVTFPPHVKSVFGISNPYEWAIDVTASFDPRRDAGEVDVKTSLGKALRAEFQYMRALPEAA
jgi:hypothetical protein